MKCDEIAWAVIDSGIDGNHPALKGPGDRSRVVKAFDFSNIRKIVSLDCRDIVVGLGTFHCLTQQVPVAPD